MPKVRSVPAAAGTHSFPLVVLGTLRQWWLARKGDLGLTAIVGFNLRRRKCRRLLGDVPAGSEPAGQPCHVMAEKHGQSLSNLSLLLLFNNSSIQTPQNLLPLNLWRSVWARVTCVTEGFIETLPFRRAHRGADATRDLALAFVVPTLVSCCRSNTSSPHEQLSTTGFPSVGPALARQLWGKAGREPRARPGGFVLLVGEGRQLPLPAAAGASIILRGMERNNQSPGLSREGFCACVGRKGGRQRLRRRDSHGQGGTPRHTTNSSSCARSLHTWPRVCTAQTTRHAPN